MKNNSPPLKQKSHWKKRHYKKNNQKIENHVFTVLAEEIRNEIDASILAHICEVAINK